MAKSKSASEERLGEQLVEIGGKVRIERGPKLKTGKATEELLSDDVTAKHYHLPRKVTNKDGSTEMVFARDAKGKVIKHGEELTYLDWIGEHHWYVYALRTEVLKDASGNDLLDENGEARTQERWVEVDAVDGEEDEALARAHEVLASEE